MKRVAFVIYRQWAYEIFKSVLAYEKENAGFEVSLLITSPKAEFDLEEAKHFRNLAIIDHENDTETIDALLSKSNVEVVCYYSWSWLVREPILTKYICLCLHPSPLPKFRGGSPIQNQIIAGVRDSALSHFRMKAGIDDGDIHMQLPMSLDGNVEDIFERMGSCGAAISRKFIAEYVMGEAVFTPQSGLSDNPPLKRRKPEQSEIKLVDASLTKFIQINNMVRSLRDPYPNAYVSLPAGRLLIQGVCYLPERPREGIILNDVPLWSIGHPDGTLCLALADGYAQITECAFASNERSILKT
ncbi:MAG: hypothetical protein H7837_12380 [Magnetococcus sp. MYC-9]